VTDGCSAFANDGWVECCVEHGAVYWCGGTAEERRQADRRLSQCVADLGHPCRARLMYLGVRAGGPAWIPLPWRWGFGWHFPYAGDPRDGPATRRDAAGASAAVLGTIGCSVPARWLTPETPSRRDAGILLSEESTAALAHRLRPTGIPDIPLRKHLRPCCAFGCNLRARVAFLPILGYRLENLKTIDEIGPHH
jgi:hypothetical protein